MHVERLQDFPSQTLAPKSLQALGIVLSGGTELTEGQCFNPMDLAAFVPALQTHATVHICVVGDGGGDLRPIHTSFLLAGLKSVSESKREDGSRVLSATVASPPSTSKNQLLSSAAPIKLLQNDEDDLVDEDALLSSSVLAPPPAMSAVAAASADDCSGRQPCDNCTCGRAADAADKAAATTPTTAVASSACGKCHLGDAFRCASCPHLGKPAFKAGEGHLVLDLQDDL